MSAEWKKGLRCIVSGHPMPDFHHVKSRGSGGTDDLWNIIPIAHAIHVEWHMKGTRYMAEKYPAICDWLLDNCWDICESTGKWIHHDIEEEY